MPKVLNQPQSGNEMPRFAGRGTMMRLPSASSLDQLDVGFIGVPYDLGCSVKSGTRYGPRQIRNESTFIRPYNMGTGAAPFDSLTVADIGDVAINPFNPVESMRIIEEAFAEIARYPMTPLIMGGDHTITLPILRGLTKRHGPVGLVHIDAHADTNDLLFGEKINHGTTFRRAVEEGLLDCKRVVQIGLRGQGYTAQDHQWGADQGFRVVKAEACWHKSLAPLMAEVREQMGAGPVYLSFDMDSIDPSCAPGVGSPEFGGLTSIQALEILRGCRGVNVIGGDVVEVCPAVDLSGITSQLAVNLLFEMLCILPGVAAR